MSLIYLPESNIEASFLTAIHAFSLHQKKHISYNLDQINYPPLNISFCLLNFLSTQRQLKPNFHQELFTQDIHSLSQLSLDEGAIALFPLFLYFHGDNHNLEQILERIKTNHLPSNFNINSWKILIIVISLIIEKKIKNTNICKEIINYFEEYQEEDIRDIKLIDKLISARIYLTQAEEILRENVDRNSLGIYQSIYNFFCLPDNPKITLLRSQQFTNSQETTRILTGFLLGLNNDYDYIPPLGDIQYQGITIDKIITQFVAQWQGKIAQYSKPK